MGVLLSFHQHASSQVVRLSLLAQLSVYLDVLPGYRIRLKEDEPDQTLSKDVRALRKFETNLVTRYQEYLKGLEKLVQGKNEFCVNFF